MKKLMIAAAVVCAAVMAQAYTYNWAVGSSEIYAGNASTLVGQNVSVYLFNALDYSQQTLLDDLITNKKSWETVSANAVGGTVKTDKDSIANTFTEKGDLSGFGTLTTDNKMKAYFAIFQDGKVFLSNTATKTADMSASTANTALSFTSYQTPTKNMKEGSTFASTKAGWYTAVPEPTSGLLLLLGVAGLALRRRRA